MRDIASMTPDEILAAYFGEKRRRENPPSLAGVDPEAPREKKPSSGRYEELLLLTVGADPKSLQLMYEASSSYRLASWTCGVSGCQQAIEHEHRPILGSDNQPLTVGGVELTQPVAKTVTVAIWGKAHGLSEKESKKMVRDVLDVVAENLARRKRATRDERAATMLERLKVMARKAWE